MTDTKILHSKYTEHTLNTDQSALLSLQVQRKCIFHTSFPLDNLGIANDVVELFFLREQTCISGSLQKTEPSNQQPRPLSI